MFLRSYYWDTDTDENDKMPVVIEVIRLKMTNQSSADWLFKKKKRRLFFHGCSDSLATVSLYT